MSSSEFSAPNSLLLKRIQKFDWSSNCDANIWLLRSPIRSQSKNRKEVQNRKRSQSHYISHTAIKAYASMFQGWSLSILCGGVCIEVVVAQTNSIIRWVFKLWRANMKIYGFYVLQLKVGKLFLQIQCSFMVVLCSNLGKLFLHI